MITTTVTGTLSLSLHPGEAKLTIVQVGDEVTQERAN